MAVNSHWYDPTGNRVLAYRFGCKGSIHSTTTSPKRIPLERSLIKEMRATCDNKKVPQTLFHYFSYLQK